MVITVTELKQNQKKYLEKALEEDILVEKDGRIIARISSPFKDSVTSLRSLRGIIPSDANIEEIKNERLTKI
jgi:hypothetical protein